MRDILDAIAYEARQLGVDAAVVDDSFPDGDDVAYVTIPHEYFATTDKKLWPSRRQLSRTIALTVEHPGTNHFEISEQQSRRCAMAFDINRDSTQELRRRGRSAEHFQIGYTRAWDARQPGTTRDIDVLYLGGKDGRRDKALAQAAPYWWDLRTRLVIAPVMPHSAASEDFPTGRAKFGLLSRSTLVVNMHRMSSRCLEWVRVMEAICNGALVVSEHSSDAAPFVAGRHYISTELDHLGLIVRGLLEDPAEVARLAAQAEVFVLEHLPMSTSVERLVDAAAELVTTPGTVPALHDIPEAPGYQPPTPGWPAAVTQTELLAASLRRLETGLMRTQRSLAELSLRLDGATDRPTETLETPAYAVTEPTVSVIVPLYNYQHHIVEALGSLAATTEVAFDVLIWDDASTDASYQVAGDYLLAHPGLPAKMIRGAVNRGLSATRNQLLRHSRGAYVFNLDADNGVFPTCLSRLAAALDEHPEAAFAYAPIATRRLGEYVGLLSEHPWMPELFRRGNYIDAMAMIRRSTVERFGGWDESMLHGWEDFQLWVRLAEAGCTAAFVPQVLSWYRLSENSMLMGTNLDSVSLWSTIRAAGPTLMAERPAGKG